MRQRSFVLSARLNLSSSQSTKLVFAERSDKSTPILITFLCRLLKYQNSKKLPPPFHTLLSVTVLPVAFVKSLITMINID